MNHRLRIRSRRMALDPIRVRIRVELQGQRVFTAKPHDKGYRRHNPVKQDTHHDRIRDLVEKRPESHPNKIQRTQNARANKRRRQKRGTHAKRPKSHRSMAPQRDQPDQCEKTEKNQAERRVGRRFDDMRSVQVFMRGHKLLLTTAMGPVNNLQWIKRLIAHYR